jgi:hypothetical protein
MNKLFLFIAAVFLLPVFGFSQDFGFDGENSAGAIPAVTITGDISASFQFFTEDCVSAEKIRGIELGNVFSGKINFSAGGKAADAFIGLKIDPVFSRAFPGASIAIDEAYLRLYFGPVDIEGGIRKITWGRADSFGPLDVVNPVDYSDLSAISSPRNVKLARPMLHINWNINAFSKLEGVFVPWFAGNEYAMDGRWAPPVITGIGSSLVEDLISQFSLSGTGIDTLLNAWEKTFDIMEIYRNSDNTLEFAQGGLRFTTTIGETDLGVQYYFGRLPRPAYTVNLKEFKATFVPEKIDVLVNNNYYHQIGIDFAMVIAGFNIRAEAGINITGDFNGDDETVYNPHLVWSFGFDRDLIWGINLNLQGNGLFRFMYDKIGGDPLVIDTEDGRKITSTRITSILSRKFFQDSLELKTTVLWGIEDRDFFIVPALVWSKNDVTAEISAGIFCGEKTGELGQYKDNGYVKTVLSRSF